LRSSVSPHQSECGTSRIDHGIVISAMGHDLSIRSLAGTAALPQVPHILGESRGDWLGPKPDLRARVAGRKSRSGRRRKIDLAGLGGRIA
jgi:hypothetical protein